MIVRILAVSLVLILCNSAYALTPVDKSSYIRLKNKMATKLSVQELGARPAEYVGKTFEARGEFCGALSSDSGTTLILKTAKHGSFHVRSKNASSDIIGTSAVCLIRLGEGCRGSLSGLNDLELVAWVPEAYFPHKPAEKQNETIEQVVDAEQTGRENEITADTAELISAYKSAIKGFNPGLGEKDLDTITRSILGFSHKYEVDPRLVCAVILAESRFRVNATSHAGAQGLGQLMPATAAGMGINNSYDPTQNIYGSVRYIRSMLDRMSGNKKWDQLTFNDLALALAAYNAGPGAVKKHGGVPPYRETQNYVKKVTYIYKKLCGVAD